MPLSVVDIYQKILPKTNCGDCGYPTCLAFASMVVSEKLPLANCPHVDEEILEKYRPELEEQYAAEKWTKKDMAHDALEWARERSASMKMEDLPGRIGGTLKEHEGVKVLELPYFAGTVLVKEEGVFAKDGSPLNRWEQVFIYNHMAQGGSAIPNGVWKGLEQIPNTVSKIKSMKAHVEEPLIERFRGRSKELLKAALPLGGRNVDHEHPSADVAILFRPLPRIPLLLLFWDEEEDEAFEAGVKLLFDETITEHLDIESIMFLSERLRQLLVGDEI